MIGKAGADELQGGGGDDILVFDQDDTIILGGEGYDTGIYKGTGALHDFDMNAHELEVLIAGSGNDTIIIGPSDQVQMVAGGGGDDVFRVDTTGDAPIVIFGGSGADEIEITQGSARILTLNVSGLNESNFNQFDLSCINGYENINWSEFDLVVLNPGSSDRVGYSWFDDNGDPMLWEIGGSSGSLGDIVAYLVASVSTEGVPFPFEYDFSAYQNVSFLGSAITRVFAPVAYGYSSGVGGDDLNLPGLHGVGYWTWIGGEDGNGGVYIIPENVWAYYGSYDDPQGSLPSHSSNETLGRYVAGGRFDGAVLETDGSITADFNPVPQPDWFLAA